jgi:hypothetical protein
MRRGAVLPMLALVAALAAPAPALAGDRAAPPPPGPAVSPPLPGAGKVIGKDPDAPEPAADEFGDGQAGRATRTPAVGAPYNWRQMGFAAAIMLAMLGFVVWLVRRSRPNPASVKRGRTRGSRRRGRRRRRDLADAERGR